MWTKPVLYHESVKECAVRMSAVERDRLMWRIFHHICRASYVYGDIARHGIIALFQSGYPFYSSGEIRYLLEKLVKAGLVIKIRHTRGWYVWYTYVSGDEWKIRAKVGK